MTRNTSIVCLHSVIVNVARELDEASPDLVIGAVLRPIILAHLKWMEEQGVTEVAKGSWDGLYGEEIEYLFHNEADALLFKLTFGGQ